MSESSELSLHSPIVAKMVALELLERQAELPDAVQTFIKQEIADPANLTHRISGLVSVSVDLTRLLHYTSANLNSTWEQKALSFLLVRQATYPLLQMLVPGISRQEVSKLRAQVGANLPAPRPPTIPTSELEAVYQAWRLSIGESERPLEQWVNLAMRLPQWPLTSLYQVLVIEGARV